ncbi:transposase [Alkalimarinus sediminis]|uniref:Transposase n=2 Tax=Alkalimarinus sediminis TaxID=1632866 RepID=A0A9E8HGV7_9ALTE|nr:transposase [Alkalimarinus sediminis]UZW74430.1 transposase [Alkalimarinus sediminis]UZW74434.1 transposase [Alkalimarinus sediminis]
MPRKPRFYLPNVPVHIVHRGHSRSAVFFEDQDYSTYLYWLKKAAEKYSLSIHAFVLMTNHVHLLVTPKLGEDVSLFMQYIGRRYVPYINHKYGKSGSIWEGRYKACLVQEDTYFLSVMVYIELNPVRANMVESPSHYRWSSFCHNTGVQNIKLIDSHSIYELLGVDKVSRTKAYQALFESHLDKDSMKKISDAWLTGTPLGNDYFREMIENTLVKKVGQDRRGRPSKQTKRALTP